MRLARKLSSDNPTKVAATLFLLAGLSLLVGCQGFSSGSSSTKNQQQQTGSLSLSASTLDFGSVTTGTTKTQTVTLTNTGASSINISQASASGTGFQLSGIAPPLSLNAAQSATFTVAFSPQSSSSASGTVTITSDASNPTLTMALSGTGVPVGALGSNPTSISFGSVTVGSKQTLSETVTNTGSSSITISQVGIDAGFTLSGITTPLTVGGGQSANFSVSFDPQSAGGVSGAITVTSTASNATLTIPVSGTGTVTVGQLTVSPATLGIGNVVVGNSGSGSGTLTASGASVTVTGASTNNSTFSVGGLPLPVTIPAGQTQPFTVTFSPLVKGAASASLSFTSSAQPSTTVETLTGTGTAAPTHSVNLSWNASSSSDISGYNVYRALYGTSCGGYSKINPVLNTTTLYTDNTVADGTSYCYAATAVNSSNEESSYSNIISNVQIPAQ